MADFCDIRQHGKFLTLKEMSGLSDLVILDKIKATLETEGRFPELDELPNINSEPYLRKLINLKSTDKGTGYTTLADILKINEDTKLANTTLNNTYKDLHIEITPIGKSALVKVEHRPTMYNTQLHTIETDIPKSLAAQKVGLLNALEKMRKFYGINILYVTSDDVIDDVKVNTAKAFIRNNTIYVNVDNATIDSPIHEILHMFLGTLTFNNPTLYYSLISSLDMSTTDKEREELFVSELARFLTGQSSQISKLPQGTINYILYNIKRDIDTIVNGEYSVNAIDTSQLFNKSLHELAEILHSDTFNVDVAAGLTRATIHRMLENEKEELLKNGELEIQCE